MNFTDANLATSFFTKILGSIWSVTFSPDGKFLAIGDTNDVISLWEVASRKEILTFKGHTNRVRSVVFSPNGQTLASGSDDSSVRIWDISNGKSIAANASKLYKDTLIEYALLLLVLMVKLLPVVVMTLRYDYGTSVAVNASKPYKDILIGYVLLLLVLMVKSLLVVVAILR